MYTPTIVHITHPLGGLQLYCLQEVMLCLSFMTLTMRLHYNIHTCKNQSINKYTHIIKTRPRPNQDDDFYTSVRY